jgi:hypothetical protein
MQTSKFYKYKYLILVLPQAFTYYFNICCIYIEINSHKEQLR